MKLDEVDHQCRRNSDLPNRTHLSPIRSEKADYSVVLVSNGSDALIRKFIKVQRYLGASAFFIYVDREFDEQEIGRSEDVTFVSIKSFYAERERPESFFDVQAEVYQDAYERCATTWLAVMDTDECIFHPRLSMDNFLKAVPAQTEFVHAWTYEAFWGSFKRSSLEFSANFCRRPGHYKLLEFEMRKLFGSCSGHANRRGTVGHASGKYLVKTGFNMGLKIHFASHNGGGARVDFLSDLGVLHYDAPSYGLWHQKFGSGNAQLAGAQHKSNGPRQSLIGDLKRNLYDKKNISIFRKLYCWNSKKRKRFLEYGDVYHLSWKWEALWNYGNCGQQAVNKFQESGRAGLGQRLILFAKASPLLQWTRPIAKALRLI